MTTQAQINAALATINEAQKVQTASVNSDLRSPIWTRKNTHELVEGDIVFHYGHYMELHTRKTYPMRHDDCPVMQGECVTFETRFIAEDNGQIPKHWHNTYTIQGNKLATWLVVS